MEKFLNNVVEEEMKVKDTDESIEVLPSNKMVRIFQGALAGAMMMGTAHAAGGPKLDFENLDEQKIEHKSVDAEHKETKEQKLAKYNGWLNEFGDKTLSIGKVKNLIRSPCEQLGIYKNGEHIGDIYGTYYFTFDEFNFIENVSEVLDKAHVKYTKAEYKHPGFETEVRPGVLELAKKLSEHGLVSGYFKDGGKKKLLFKNRQEDIKIDGKDQFSIDVDMESDNNPDTYTTISVNKAGDSIVIEGRDGELFRYEIKDGGYNEDQRQFVKIFDILKK